MFWICLGSLCVGLLTLATVIEHRSREQAPQIRRRIITQIRNKTKEIHDIGGSDHDPVFSKYSQSGR